jgi:hypothetical protein
MNAVPVYSLPPNKVMEVKMILAVVERKSEEGITV